MKLTLKIVAFLIFAGVGSACLEPSRLPFWQWMLGGVCFIWSANLLISIGRHVGYKP